VLFWVAFLGAVPWLFPTSILNGNRNLPTFILQTRWHFVKVRFGLARSFDSYSLSPALNDNQAYHVLRRCLFSSGTGSSELGPTVMVWSMADIDHMNGRMGSWDNGVFLWGKHNADTVEGRHTSPGMDLGSDGVGSVTQL